MVAKRYLRPSICINYKTLYKLLLHMKTLRIIIIVFIILLLSKAHFTTRRSIYYGMQFYNEIVLTGTFISYTEIFLSLSSILGLHGVPKNQHPNAEQ